jgi:hypothetical protein
MSCRKKEALYYLKEFENFSVNLPWDCFVYILTKLLGLEMKKKPGSKRAFTNGRITFTADEPHGKGDCYVHKYDRQNAIVQLKRIELL